MTNPYAPTVTTEPRDRAGQMSRTAYQVHDPLTHATTYAYADDPERPGIIQITGFTTRPPYSPDRREEEQRQRDTIARAREELARHVNGPAIVYPYQ